MAKNPLIFPIMFIGVLGKYIFNLASVALVAGGLTVFSETLNKYVFERKHIATEKDKYEIIRTLGLYVALYLFGLASAVMSLRILTGKSTPASNNDPIFINTLNRIITNTIEQTIIFAGLYGALLFSDVSHITKIGGAKVLAIASLFVIGRVIYLIGYILGAITKIPTFRSGGFAIGLFVNTILVLYHFGFNSFNLLDNYAAPVLKGFLN